jgi:PilZ domain
MAILGNSIDRRTSRRRPLHEIPEVIGVKVQSEKVEVVDASREGILIECSLRLTPGTMSQLEILRVDGPVRVRGRVVRCEIKAISGDKVQYRVAIAFNQRLDFIEDSEPLEELGAPALAAEAAAPVLAAQAPGVSDVNEVAEVTDATEVTEITEISESDSAFTLNGW